MSLLRYNRVGQDTLHRLAREAQTLNRGATFTVDAGLLDELQDEISDAFWDWLLRNPEQKVLSVGWWKIRFTVRRKDLVPLWIHLFGHNPNVPEGS